MMVFVRLTADLSKPGRVYKVTSQDEHRISFTDMKGGLTQRVPFPELTVSVKNLNLASNSIIASPPPLPSIGTFSNTCLTPFLTSDKTPSNEFLSNLILPDKLKQDRLNKDRISGVSYRDNKMDCRMNLDWESR